MATFSLYDVTIGTADHALNTLLNLLKKAQTHAEASTIPEDKIAPDMLPFRYQVMIVCSFSKKFVERLTSRTLEPVEDNQKTLEELVERVEKTLELLKTVTREEIDGTTVKTTSIKMGPLPAADATVQQYVLTYSLPNLFFHLTTAYDILRMKGLQIGKADYLSHFVADWVKQAPEQ